MRRFWVVAPALTAAALISLLGVASGQRGGPPLARLDASNVFTGEVNRFEGRVEVAHRDREGFHVTTDLPAADRFEVAAITGEYNNPGGQGIGLKGIALGVDGIGVQGHANVDNGGIGVTGAVSNPGGIGVLAFNPVASGFGTALSAVVHSPEAIAGVFTNLGGGDILVAQSSFDQNVLTITNDGQIVQASAADMKRDVEPIQDALEKVVQLNGVSFRWKSTGRPDIGFLAEDVADVVPEVVHAEAESGEVRGMEYGRITALLVEALKEQEARIRELEAQIAQLDRDR